MSGETIDAEVVADTPPPLPPPRPQRKPEIPVAAFAMLDALRSGGGDTQAMLMQALAGQGGIPPEMSMLMKMVMTDAAPEREDLHDEIRAEVRAEQSQVLAEISDVAERLMAENQAARARLDALAAGIGACPVCFGEDVLCDTCGGMGRPGSRLPEPAAFNLYVSPACRRVQAELRTVPPHGPWPRSPAGRALPPYVSFGATMQSGE